MKELDENTALAIMFANTRRKKRTEDLLTIAKACEYLVKLYGSQKTVAKKVGLSTEMIREFMTALKLPIEIQNLISERKIDSVDIVREIASIKDKSRQITVANTFINSLSKDARDIKRLIKNTNFSVEDAQKTILDSKPKELHVFVIDFNDEVYHALIKQSKNLKVRPAELVKRIITDWLRGKTEQEK